MNVIDKYFKQMQQMSFDISIRIFYILYILYQILFVIF